MESRTKDGILRVCAVSAKILNIPSFWGGLTVPWYAGPSGLSRPEQICSGGFGCSSSMHTALQIRDNVGGTSDIHPITWGVGESSLVPVHYKYNGHLS